MIVGNKFEFAIEYTIQEFYQSNFIGDGMFIIYIENIVYGKIDERQTTFSGIIPSLGRRAKEVNIVHDYLKNIDTMDLCDAWFQYSFQKENGTRIDASVMKLISKYDIEWHTMDEAFDDGSTVLQINEGNTVRLIGLKYDTNYSDYKKSINYISLPTNVFCNTIEMFIESIKSDFRNTYNDGYMPQVFSFWK
jgi:hypothetical protein